MTGNTAKTLAQARVKNTNTTNYDWNSFFGFVTDEVFSAREWRFARKQLNYIHPQQTFEKTFNLTTTEKSLNKVISLRYTSSYTIVMGVPVPVSNSSYELDFKPLQEFMYWYPDQITAGDPFCYTELHGNDGTNGMQIGIYYLPTTDIAVWIDGIFIPSYDINTQGNLVIPILPVQFHRLYVYGMASLAASQAGQDRLFGTERKLFELTLNQLVRYDAANPKHKLFRRSIEDSNLERKGPFFPANFPRGYSR